MPVDPTVGGLKVRMVPDANGAHHQFVVLEFADPSTPDGTPIRIPGDLLNGMDVDVTRMPAQGTPGAAVPGSALAVGGFDGATFRAFVLNALGHLSTRIENAPDVSVISSVPVALATGQGVVLNPAASGGLSAYSVVAGATTNAASVKGSAGQVYGWYITNTNANEMYVKLYNLAVAPTVGTSTPFMRILVPGSTTGAGCAVEFSSGIQFTAGIGIATTVNPTNADNTALPVADEVIVNLLYR